MHDSKSENETQPQEERHVGHGPGHEIVRSYREKKYQPLPWYPPLFSLAAVPPLRARSTSLLAASATCSTNRPFRPLRDAAPRRRGRGAAGGPRLPRAAALVVPPRASGFGPGSRAPRPAAAAPRALAAAPRDGREHATAFLRSAAAGLQLRWGGRLRAASGASGA